MPEAKSFNNIIIGQFALTGIPTKVYVNGRFLTITDPDDVENPLIGFGMDENGAMIQFDYIQVEKLSIAGNDVDIKTYNKGMEKKFGADEEGGDKEGGEKEDDKEEGGEEEEKPKAAGDFDPTKESYNLEEDLPVKLKDLVSTKVFADNPLSEGPEAEKAQKVVDKVKQDLIKAKEDKLEAEKEELGEGHQEYTFGTGDIVKDINPKCPHYGSKGIIQKMMDIPDKGIVAIYTVTNAGGTFKPGDKLAKTIDQLEKI